MVRSGCIALGVAIICSSLASATSSAQGALQQRTSPEQVGDLQDLATFSRDYYDALIERGFSEEQAIRIVSNVGLSLEPRTEDADKVTYVVDADLIRFAKFAAAILGIFTVVGLFLFGFNLKDMVKQLSVAQNTLATSEAKLGEAQARMEAGLGQLRAASDNVERLQVETESLKRKADQAVQAISRSEVKSRELLLAIETRSGSATIMAVPSEERSVTSLENSKLWKNGSVLRIAFIGGSEDHHHTVRDTASEWTEHANLEFVFDVAAKDAVIRISFEAGSGSWSYVGRDALNVATTTATMNLDQSWTKDDLRTAIRRQFGFALGLLQEHLNPDAKIPWDRQGAFVHFGAAPNFWSRAKVQFHFFTPWAPGSFPIEKDYDPSSIMHQTIPNELTVGDFAIKGSTTLSEGDKRWVAQLYPSL